MPRPSRQRAVPGWEERAEVLRQAQRDGQTVSLDVDLAGGTHLSVSGVPRHVGDRSVELVTVSGTLRSVLLSRVRCARVVPERHAGAATGAIEKWGERW